MIASAISLGIWMLLIMYRIWCIEKRVDRLEAEIDDIRSIEKRIDKLEEENDEV